MLPFLKQNSQNISTFSYLLKNVIINISYSTVLRTHQCLITRQIFFLVFLSECSYLFPFYQTLRQLFLAAYRVCAYCHPISIFQLLAFNLRDVKISKAIFKIIITKKSFYGWMITQTVEYYSAIKREKFLIHTATWLHLKFIILSAGSRTLRLYGVNRFVTFGKGQTCRDRKQSSGCWGLNVRWGIDNQGTWGKFLK